MNFAAPRRHALPALAIACLLCGCPYHHVVRVDEPDVIEPGPRLPQDYRVVDLSHPVREGMPSFPGSEPYTRRPMAQFEPDGYYSAAFSMDEHTATHVDAPLHFVEGGLSVDRIPAARLVLPGVVLDVSRRCGADPDYRLALDDVLAWEAAHGEVPEGAAVLLRTGWDRLWDDPQAYRGTDAAGGMHFPGYSREAAGYLVERRHAHALGVDSLSTDHGPSQDFPVHRLALGAGLYQMENLRKLDALPPRGFVVVVAPLPLEGGSGAPARVLALVPDIEEDD